MTDFVEQIFDAVHV